MTTFQPYKRNAFTTNKYQNSIPYNFSFIDDITPLKLTVTNGNANDTENASQIEPTAAIEYTQEDDENDLKIGPIDFHVKINSEITVTASIQFIKTFFQEQKAHFQSNLRPWGKFRKDPIFQWHTRFSFQITQISDGTYALYYHKPIIFSSFVDFSNIFVYFCKKSQKVYLPTIFDTFSINEFISFFCLKKTFSVRNLEQLKRK